MTEKFVCPICSEFRLTIQHTCRDHVVSYETFQILECGECGFWLTFPQPRKHELTKYYLSDNYVSHSTTASGLINILYYLVRHCTLWLKLKLIERHKQKGVLMDVGCGTGNFLKRAQTAGWQIIGVEPDQRAAKNAAQLLNIEVIPPDNIQSIADHTIDVITLWHVLEHIPDIHAVFGQLTKKLKPNGLLVVAMPNHRSYDAKHYKEFWAGFDVPRHLWHFTPETFEKFISKYDLEVVKIKPMWFDAFYVSMLSEKYMKKAIPLIGLWTGLVSNFKAMLSSQPVCSSQIYLIKKRAKR